MIKVKDLFDVVYGVNLEYNKMIPSVSGIPFIARTSVDNGIVGYVEKMENITANPAHTISVACSGSVLESFLQEQDYYSGHHVYYLSPKKPMNKEKMLFYCMVLRANKYRYSYGRKANRTLKNILIPLLEDIPTWAKNIKLPKKPTNKR